MRPTLSAGLYGIADAALGDPILWGTALAEAGCPTLQLRAKTWSAAQLLDAAIQLRAVTRRTGTTLIINDHPEIAYKSGADGVHLGQDDGMPASARRLLGPSALIGLSTHSMDQACDPKGADYIGYGPVFSTTTKAEAGMPRGVDELKAVVLASKVPVVAIGGILPSHIETIKDSGVHAWALISALTTFKTAQDAVSATHV